VDLVANLQRHRLEREIASAGRWITKFEFDGVASGGDYDPAHDPRLIEFRQAFPNARRVLDLGALEGGHALALAAAQPGTRVTAVDGRQEHADRARLAARLLDVPNVAVFEADLDKTPPRRLGHHDAAFCCALLHHLERPWLLVDGLPEAAAGAYFWTHVTAERDVSGELDGVPGRWQREAPHRTLGGLGYRSFIPTLDGLVGRLRGAGYRNIEATVVDHVNGPAATVIARS
jgi:hypothetical protein